MGRIRSCSQAPAVSMLGPQLMGRSAVMGTVALLLAWVTAPSCAPQIQCQALAKDQKASLSAPIPQASARGLKPGTALISVDSRFSADEAARIGRAIDEWNRVAQADWKQTIWVPQSTATASQASALSSSASEMSQWIDCKRENLMEGNAFVIKRIDRSNEWTQTLGLPADAMGLTARCISGTQLVGQVILINAERTPADQLASVVVHELGHAAGLDHSCQTGNGSEDYVSCDKLSDNHPYKKAVMYPSMWSLTRGNQVVASESKESLQTNDRERAQCHYKAQ